jgi:RNA polymerase sigma-70 factor, ECF subfamily
MATISDVEDSYATVMAQHGAALQRLARAYEADPERRRDLLQDIHFQVWRSLASFDDRCSMRTWVYRVAHNTAASHVVREKRAHGRFVSLEEIDSEPVTATHADASIDAERALERLSDFIRQLNPVDRQVIVCYLEGFSADATAEITGVSPTNIAMKVARVKQALSKRFGKEFSHGKVIRASYGSNSRSNHSRR